jgi:hypothetical protein
MMLVDKDLLNLAGEYRVCSELLKRGVFATITYGHRKAVDVYTISDRQERALKIEVKTSQKGRFVTSLSRKAGWASSHTTPDFWVLCYIQFHRDATWDRAVLLSQSPRDLRHSGRTQQSLPKDSRQTV